MSGILPSYIDQVNTVLRWWENPCDAPWTLYAELALPAAGEAALNLLAFGLDDIVRGYFRPKGLRTGRHGRKGRKSGRRGGGIPEVGEEIGKRLPGAEQARGRHVSEGVKNLWMVDGVIQRGLFYWMIADVTLDFFATWLSAVQESEVCRTMRIGAASFEDTNTHLAIGDWGPIGAVNVLYEHGSVHVQGSGLIRTGAFSWTGGGATATFAVERVKRQGEIIDNTFLVRVVQGQNIIYEAEATDDPNKPGRQTAVISPRFFRSAGGAALQVRVEPSGSARLHSLGVCVQTLQDI